MSCDVSEVKERLEWAEFILQPFLHFTYVTTHSPTLPSLYLRHSSFSSLPLLYLHHSSFSNPSFASPTSQALHIIHLASRPWNEPLWRASIPGIYRIPNQRWKGWRMRCDMSMRNNLRQLPALTFSRSLAGNLRGWDLTIERNEELHLWQLIRALFLSVSATIFCENFVTNVDMHGRFAKWRKWRACDVGEAKEGFGEWSVT